MNWKRVRRRLRDFLCNDCEHGRLDRWLDHLGKSEPGHHLGACILIDMKAKIVSPEVFALVLEDVDVDALDPVHEFGRAVDHLEKRDDGPTWRGRLSEDDQYAPRECARVLELGQFVRYCLPEKSVIISNDSLKTIR